jgi:8-oxo-dGTP pyrophosphatase MutT (NUDIX family)
MLSEGWWAVPGGRLEEGETSATALAREMHEELGIRIEGAELSAVIETRFEHGGTEYQEVGLYFEVDRPTVPDEPLVRRDGDRDCEFRWFPLGDLAGLDVRPQCIDRLLLGGTQGVLHLVQNDL